MPKSMKTKRVFLWVCAALLTLLAVYPVIASYAHWESSAFGFIIWPVTIGLLLIVINRLRNFDYSSTESVATGCSLKVDYRVRYSLISTMKNKRWTAWLLHAMAILVAIVTIYLILWSEIPAAALLFVPSGLLYWMGLSTLKNAKAIEKSLKTNDQTAFNEAVSRWSKQYRFTILGYVLIVIIPILIIVLASIGAV